MDENMFDIGSMSCHMYFLNPRPTATSLKHCLQKLSPYFLTIGPYWPHRLHGRAPLPYFRCFLGLILAMSGSASYVCAEVVDRKSTRLNSSHITISYAVFCLKKKK